jgi:hypothetical protein
MDRIKPEWLGAENMAQEIQREKYGASAVFNGSDD